MAKFHGIGSASIRGKAGGMVYCKGLGGETIMRPYQPQVKNPKTARQVCSRKRFAYASQLAADLAGVISVGYAKAAAGLAMYPRNVFVRGIVPLSKGVLEIVDGDPQIQFDRVKVSEKDGINDLMSIGSAASTAAGVVTLAVSSVPANPNPDAGEYGVVGVVYVANEHVSFMTQVLASAATTSGLTFNLGASYTGKQVYVWAFLKWIPASENDVVTTTQPWKYPSATGASQYAGTVIVA